MSTEADNQAAGCLSPSEVTVVFFDIDGTLIDTHGAGRSAFSDALKEVFGFEDDLRFINFAGATDMDVFNGVMSSRSIRPTRKQVRAFFNELPVKLERTIKEHIVQMCPGARELVAALASHPKALVGLITGNTEECAHIKLRSCDLHGHFVLGAFGREHARRADIARLALRRAKEHLPRSQRIIDCFVIGDTPSDVAAASAIGAKSIAVATGSYNVSALQSAGATHVLKDLRDTKSVMRILGL